MKNKQVQPHPGETMQTCSTNLIADCDCFVRIKNLAPRFICFFHCSLIVTFVWLPMFYFAHLMINIVNSDDPTASDFKCNPQHCKWPHQHFKKPILYGWSLSDVGLENSCDERKLCPLGILTRSAQKPTHCSHGSAWLSNSINTTF